MADNRLQALLESLMPTKEVVIFDITGKEHRCSATLPARKQQAVINRLLQILDLPAINIAGLSAIQGASPEEQIGELLATVRKVAGDDAVLRSLAEAAFLAYPAVITAAIDNVRVCEPGALEGVPNPDAADVMEVDQVLGLLLPFASRLLGGMNQKIKSVSQQAQKTLNE